MTLRCRAWQPNSIPRVQANALLGRVVAGTLAILERAGMPVAARPMVVGAAGGTPPMVRLALPSYGADQAILDALAWWVAQVNGVLAGRPAGDASTALAALVRKISRNAPRGTNSTPFLKAAHEARIPVRHLWGNVFQFGWGARARRLDSSLTDETPSLSTQLAGNKRAAARVMRNAGIPVPRHELVDSADEAVRVAGELGYPVVVKPADLEGGRGVAAGLRSEEAVRKAFKAARVMSRQVLVEKHVEGEDYRVHVHKGEAFWVSHRVPGSVTGNGKDTVAQLLAR